MKRGIYIFSLVVVLVLAIVVYWFYYNAYSDGTRIGKLFKFSRKGNVFKTYEGEILLPGSRPSGGGFQNNFFYFSVTSDSIAAILTQAQGKEVDVHYEQYRKNLPWRGKNNNDKNQEPGQYIVDKVVSIKDVPALY